MTDGVRVESTASRWFRFLSVGEHLFVPVLILTLPLEFTTLFFPFQVIQLSRIVMIVGLMFLLFQRLNHQIVDIRKKISLVVLAVLIGYEAVSAIAVRSPTGIRSFVMGATYLLVLINVYSWTRTREDLWRAWAALSLSGLVIGLLAIFLHVTGLYIWRPGPTSYLHRMNATFGDPNILARFLAVSTGTSIMLLDAAKSRYHQAILLASAIAGTVAVIFTYSRAGWLVFILTVVIAVALSKQRWKAMIAVGLLVGIVGFVALTNSNVARRTNDLLSLVSRSSESSAATPGKSHAASFGILDRIPLDVERHYLIAAGIQMFVDHPVFGVGFGQFRPNIESRYSYFLQPGYPDRLSHAAFVTILAELGLVGFGLLVLWLFWLFREVVQARANPEIERLFLVLPIPAIIAILVHSQFEERLLAEPYLWVVMGLLYAAQSRCFGATNRPSK